jgi:hypothetical protein
MVLSGPRTRSTLVRSESSKRNLPPQLGFCAAPESPLPPPPRPEGEGDFPLMLLPRVELTPSSQPWAERRNPFGIGEATPLPQPSFKIMLLEVGGVVLN